PPLPPPDDQRDWPTHTLVGYPNQGFIAICFLHLSTEEAEWLRTLLNNVLDSAWWRNGRFVDAPEGTLDPFVRDT
ncbi:hypothetical protein FRC17_004515, partial [Serendipita sp. 399]